MYINTGENEKLLNQMTDLIVADCKSYSVLDYRIKRFLLNELCQYPKNSGGDDMIFTYNTTKGYSITYWERGCCNFGFGCSDPLGFRFLFQLYIVNNLYSHRVDAETKCKAQEVMQNLKQTFGSTEEYRKAIAQFIRIWPDFQK